MRGKNIRILMWFAFCFIVFPGLLSADSFSVDFDGAEINESLNASAVPDHITLTWSHDPKTTQTITWRSNFTAGTGEVKYREAQKPEADSLTEKVTAKKFSAVTGDKPGGFNLFSVTLKNLKAGTRYIYKVFSGVNAGPELSFLTEGLNEDFFEFLVFGDSQSGDKSFPVFSPWHETVTKAYARHTAAKFMINVGDLTEAGMSYMHWNNWFKASENVISRIPEMPVVGNHEGVGETPTASSSTPPYYLEQFPVFQNAPKDLKGMNYSYDYGNLHITVLNSEQVYAAEEIARSQVKWLDQDLSSTGKTWKIVFFHRAPYYNKANRANEAVKKAYCPLIDKYRVDVVFNGHEHGFARTFPIRGDKLFSSPNDGTVYYVTGRSGNSCYRDLSKKIWDAFFYDPQDLPCYQTVQVKKNALTITAYKQDGTVIDVYNIDKQSKENNSLSLAPARYGSARFAVYGDFPSFQASGNLGTARLVDGKWFVNAKIFMGCIGGGAVLSSGKTELFYETRSLKVPPEQTIIINEKKIVFIPAEVIKQFLGFDFNYDESLNVLFFIK